MTGKLTIKWGAMKCHVVKMTEAITDAITAPATLVLDFVSYSFNVYIGPTKIIMDLDPLNWDVEPCEVVNQPSEPVTVYLHAQIPEEPCELRMSFHDPHLFMRVDAVEGPVIITLPDGRVGKGKLPLPETKSLPTGLKTWEVQPCVSECEITFD